MNFSNRKRVEEQNKPMALIILSNDREEVSSACISYILCRQHYKQTTVLAVILDVKDNKDFNAVAE